MPLEEEWEELPSRETRETIEGILMPEKKGETVAEDPDIERSRKALKEILRPENEETIARLCGKPGGHFYAGNVRIYFLTEDSPGVRQFQIMDKRGGGWNLGSWRNDLRGLAKNMHEANMTTENIETFLDTIRGNRLDRNPHFG